MGKFRTAAPLPRPAPTAPVTSLSPAPDALTAEGGEGWARDAKSELYLLAVTNMVGEQTFYETAGARDARFEALVARVAAEDPDWLARFVPYLRNELNMRSASLVMAAESVRVRLAGGGAVGTVASRDVVDRAIQRADEPAELIGYWRSRYGRALPQPIRAGIRLAVGRLYDERAYLKYGSGEGVRMADVVEIVHPAPVAEWQRELFHLMLDERHGREDKHVGESLATIRANRAALALDPAAFRAAFSADFAREAGLTWETASSRYGKLDAAFWTAMVPSMGYMALLRNLRNFDQSSIPDEVAAAVAARLADPAEVARSRQLPLRFYSAYRAVSSVRWHDALERALNASLSSIPALPGRTLVLVDCSGSMDDRLSARSDLRRRDAAAAFAAAISLRADDATLVPYANVGVKVRIPRGGAVLPLARAIEKATGGGTRTIDVLVKEYDGHDRVVIITDEQAFSPDYSTYTGYDGGYGEATRDVRAIVSAVRGSIYTFNVGGYPVGHLPAGGGPVGPRYTFGGLSDAGFRAIAELERGGAVAWPF